MDYIVIKFAVVIALFVAVIALVISLASIKNEIPKDRREYMDPLPGTIRMIWPIVLFFTYYIGDKISVDTLEKYSKSLKRSGLNYVLTPEQFVGLKVTAGIFMGLVTYIILLLLNMSSWLYLLLGFALGVFLPSLTMNDMKKKREKLLVRALPVYLDYLTMAVQAGMNMTGAIQQSVDKGPDGPLKVEFSKVLRDIKAGMPRVDAIREMSVRLDVREINAFTTSIIQAEKTGASVGASLKIQADQRRSERFQRAEKLAMEAPVKLIFPLVAFIFPMTFLVLFFPIVMKMIYEL